MRTFISKGLCFLLLNLASLAVCAAEEQGTNTLKLSSASFSDGQPIPEKYTCEGKNFSPPLSWNGGVPGTKTFALTCVDPDAPGGTWTHWIIYNLPENVTELPENISKVEAPPSGGRQGVNSFHKVGYSGPCPPRGQTHHYIFEVYALNEQLQLKSKASRKDFEAAIKGHVLARGRLVGTYQKKRP
ncbi:YbhB/YbcL family Raf kinase inhibitor-like protein [Pedosphaera parvula]|uniref:PEBP family protein n=1 Tax=Pedosphaera parvula (strain Ellin514) TaxID=320771 RepID=B9XSZ6_PEDPL|nr:YbhB/YbcL family Raf kinase inhibitor-like protein [Pedosphaera parvula]EEF57031.1 PEBP family protein [Pedosphaera parvula Ellin514]